MLICFAHTIFVCFACGEPIMEAFDEPLNLVKTYFWKVIDSPTFLFIKQVELNQYI
jgi:DNA-directed RNA polymerase subunit N (RpoN/RPB10)